MAWSKDAYTTDTPSADLSDKLKDLCGSSGVKNWSFVENVPAGTGGGQSGSDNYSVDVFKCAGTGDDANSAGITFPTAWCAAFVVFVLHKAGYGGRLPDQPAWVPSWADWARKTHRTVSKVNARKGDLVCLNWPGTDPTPDHIAIVTGNLGALKRVTTVGGNEGDAVRQGWRPYSYLHTVIRVDRFRRR